MPEPMIILVDDQHADAAVGHHWAEIAIENGRVIGIVTVTTMLYIE